MRLLDLDELSRDSFTGKTAIMKFLDRYEKEHPVTEIMVRQDGEWDVVLKRRECLSDGQRP